MVSEKVLLIKLRTILHYKWLFKIISLTIFILALIFTNLKLPASSFKGNEKEIKGIINNIKIDGDQLTLEIITSEKLIAYYWFKSKEEKEHFNFKLGDHIIMKGDLIKPNNNTIFNLFNYRKYLYYQKINYLFKASQLKIITPNRKLNYYLKNLILKKIKNIPKSKEYLQAFLLGNHKQIDNKIMNTYQQNGLNHLFAISGMHISFLAITLLFILKLFKVSNQKRYLLVISFLFFYLLLTNYAPSVWRATLFFTLQTINKKYYFKIKTIDLLLITFTLLLIINPYFIYNIGFQYSFIISFYLILSLKILNKETTYLKKVFIISLIAFLVSIPLTSYYFFQINLLSPFFNLFFVPLVTFILFPLSLITFFIPFLDSILYPFIFIMEKTSLLIDQIKIGLVFLAKPNLILISLYYLIISLGLSYYPLKRYLYLSLFICLLLFHYHLNYLNPQTTIDFLDVGQGDAILIKLAYQKGSLLIDTGGFFTYPKEEWQLKEKNYSLGKDTLIPYFKSIGLKKIDYLILTHGDYDHVGESINLVENFKVEKVVFNCGEFNELEQDLIKVLDKKKIPYYSCIKELNMDDNKLYFLNNKDYGNENDNSSVIYTELNNHKFLFMGDAGVEVEQDLIEKYNLQDIDVLKVGHHGSKTSSSKNFIDKIEPKYSIISVGKNNRYGHPNKEVLDNLSNSKIYRTDQDGSIMFKIKNNKLKIETCSP